MTEGVQLPGLLLRGQAMLDSIGEFTSLNVRGGGSFKLPNTDPSDPQTDSPLPSGEGPGVRS